MCFESYILDTGYPRRFFPKQKTLVWDCIENVGWNGVVLFWVCGEYSIHGDVDVPEQSDQAEIWAEWGVKEGVERQMEVN